MELAEKIKLPEVKSIQERNRLIEFAFLCGFQSVAAEFPVAGTDGKLEVPASLREVKLDMRSVEVPDDYVAATQSAKAIPPYEWRRRTGLESLFEKGYFLKDANFDQLPDWVDVKLILPGVWNDELLIAACNVAFRIGMETTAFEGPLVAPEDYLGNAIVFEDSGECRMRFQEQDGRMLVYISGTGDELAAFTSLICETFPLLPEGQTWSDICRRMTDSFLMKDLDGQLAYLEAFQRDAETIQAYVSPEINERREAIEQRFPHVSFENYKGRKEVYRKEYDIPWEVDVFREKIEKLYAMLQPGDEVEIHAALSEERSVRNGLLRELEDRLSNREAVLKNGEIICAYKQGFSWIDEVILPKLTGMAVDKIRILFKPFLPEGQTDWLDENGATPSYTNLDSGNPDKWYDLPIRYLQELYPITDVIEKKMHLSKSQVQFEVYEGGEDITYLLQAVDKEGEVLFEDTYLAAYAERPYLDQYPEMGKVHPSTGYVRISVNGKEVLSERIQTDVEAIWDIYQKDVLSDLAEFVEQKVGEQVTVKNQPFFSRLNLEVTASEPDYRLPSREDMISSLDGLHEDMYFVGADFFKNYGVRRTGEILDAPGLILPIVKKGEGKPRFVVTLYDVTADEPKLCGKQTITAIGTRGETDVFLREIRYKERKLTASLEVKTQNDQIVKAYAKLFNEGVLASCHMFSNVNEIHLLTEENRYAMQVKPYQEPVKNLRIEDIDLLEHTLIGYEQYRSIIEQLKRVKDIAVFRTAVSYEGREIYAIELLPQWKGYLSRTKRLNLLPSEIINSRHHANEVSSTNSAFILLKRLLTDKAYQDLPEKMNLVIVPMENVDGTAIHYDLQKDNPHWKLHVARFNAIGKEFYHEHFKSDTIHTEAMGLTRLWYRYLPDIIVDNHGVPSHEWEQQFSGYTSPSFKGFWLPRSLLYGYFWYVTNEEYKSNYAVNKKLEDLIADAIGEESEMKMLNEEWMEQFEKFAHGFMPKMFPADYYKEMINYWIPFAYDPGHRYPSIRFPWITTVAYTSEVADETAQDSYLNLCARAHVTQDLAIIDLWIKGRSVFEEKQEFTDDCIKIRQIRQRPILV